MKSGYITIFKTKRYAITIRHIPRDESRGITAHARSFRIRKEVGVFSALTDQTVFRNQMKHMPLVQKILIYPRCDL